MEDRIGNQDVGNYKRNLDSNIGNCIIILTEPTTPLIFHARWDFFYLWVFYVSVSKTKINNNFNVILNNVYMDLRGKKPVFKRTKTAMERNNIFATIRRYAKKLKPQYNGDVYLETVRCYFDIPQENLEKCRYTYQGNETYAFPMSDKYIMALYTHCLVARKEAAMKDVQMEGLTEKEYRLVRLENVGEALFQALLFDDIKTEYDKIYVELYTISILS